MGKTETIVVKPEDIFDLPKYVTYNPALSKENTAQYEIIRSATHDGTLAFTKQVLLQVMSPILNRKSFFKSEEPQDMSKVNYEIGDITLTIEFHIEDGVDLPCGHYPGQVDTAKMPVRCFNKE